MTEYIITEEQVKRVVGLNSHDNAQKLIKEIRSRPAITPHNICNRECCKNHETAIIAKAKAEERERLRLVTESDLHWCIGRIECTIKENRCVKSELENTLPRLNWISDTLRSKQSEQSAIKLHTKTIYWSAVINHPVPIHAGSRVSVKASTERSEDELLLIVDGVVYGCLVRLKDESIRTD